MFNYMKKIKNVIIRFFYLYLPFILSDTRKVSFYKFFDDGYKDLLFKELMLDESSVVFDIGGYKGTFTDEIQKISDCVIYIFEPVKKYYDIILEKQKHNSKIHCFNYGLGADTINVEINIQGESSSIFMGKNNSYVECEEIRIESINKFITDYKIKKIDLLKLNIEGSEYDLLDSLFQNNQYINMIEVLLIQFHDFIPNAVQRREIIQKKLSVSHHKLFDYPFIWEKWALVKN